jgi:hypothetical protein
LQEHSWQSQDWVVDFGSRRRLEGGCGAGTDARNATFKARIKTLPHQALFSAPKDVSRFRAFGCKAVVYLNKERRETGKHTARGIDAIKKI